MNSKLFAILAGVVALGLMCFAQDATTAQDQPRPSAESARAEAQARAAVAQQQRAIEAARAAEEAEANKPKPVYRLQFMLLEIKADANSPKVRELREIAQSSRKAPRLIALADELIASGDAKATSNFVSAARHGTAAQVRSEERVPFVSMSQTTGSPQITSLGGTYDRSARVEYRCRSGSGDSLSVEFTFEQSSYPDRLDVEGYRGSARFNCSSEWEGKSGEECVLIADLPRPSGSTEVLKPAERYLLFRAERIE